jgi:hypothetical protein
MEPVKVAKVIHSEKSKDFLVVKGLKFRFQKLLAANMERWCCTKEKRKCYIKCSENGVVFGGDVMESHDAISEACLN